MKKSFLTFGFVAAFLMITANAFAAKTPWAEVKAPEITSIKISDENPNDVVVSFNALTNDQGGDLGSVEMKGPATGIADFGKTRREAKTVTFKPSSSGTYTFTVKLQRRGENEPILSASKTFTFSLPLTETQVTMLNMGKGAVALKWTPVKEAEKYIMHYQDANGKDVAVETKELKADISGLKIGQMSKIYVEAIRGKDKQSSKPVNKLIKDEIEREWFFTEYGTSTNPEINRMEMLDPNDLKFTLYSCTFDEKTGRTDRKGGKFAHLFDGISYYYTVIDPKKENFELTATVHVDYHNPTADGQEGFGLLACDTIGEMGVNMSIHYTNSAGVISQKFTTHVDGVKKEIKDGLGSRFVSGVTKEALKKDKVADYATVEENAYSYDQSADAVRTGDTYRITLKKDNTGYHTIKVMDEEQRLSEDTVTEFTLYHPEKLQVLDPDHVYVGFVVARGCNATFSDVVFKVTDPKNDPPAKEEPPVLVPLKTVVDCPSTYYSNKYPFVFYANAKGTIHVEDSNGKVLIANDKVEALVDYRKTINITKNGITDMLVTFTPEDGWEPKPVTAVNNEMFPRKYAVGQYNKDTKMYERSYKPVTLMQTVVQKSFKGEKNTLYVSPTGDVFGDGTRAKPLDLQSAIGYSQPGQTIIMLKGTYYPRKAISVEKGINGTEKAPITLKAEGKEHVVINFSQIPTAPSAFNLYGNYWKLENIDFTATPENVKALQVWGSYNEIRCCDAYLNGDTGVQVSGQAADPFEKWPHNNLIINCESFGNADPAQNNADGFGAKLTVGSGNRFVGCISHHNVDDGWDLFAKNETGPIGVVTLENCITYKNGTKLDGTGKGDGNGFKLGGDGIAIKHLLKNSISWGNGVNGITCNSNPALQLDHVISYGNGERNISLYGKGKVEQFPRTFNATGVISMKGGAGDDYKERKEILDADKSNYFFNGASTVNSDKAEYKEDIFYSVDTSKYDNGYKEDGKTFNRIPRNADGSFNIGELFLIKDPKITSGAHGLGTKQVSAVNAK